MSDLLDEYPLYFAIREMHQKFNENSGAFSWLGFCMDSAGFRQELMENQEFELIGFTVEPDALIQIEFSG